MVGWFVFVYPHKCTLERLNVQSWILTSWVRSSSSHSIGHLGRVGRIIWPLNHWTGMFLAVSLLILWRQTAEFWGFFSWLFEQSKKATHLGLGWHRHVRNCRYTTLRSRPISHPHLSPTGGLCCHVFVPSFPYGRRAVFVVHDLSVLPGGIMGLWWLQHLHLHPERWPVPLSLPGSETVPFRSLKHRQWLCIELEYTCSNMLWTWYVPCISHLYKVTNCVWIKFKQKHLSL